MKLFQQLLVAPAALGLLAPIAANAAELNIQGVSSYSSNEEVKSISQFSDLYPSDWAYQALTKMAERHGCNTSTPTGSITRYEAAALLNKCLGSVAQINDEERRLLNEFGPELAVIKGRVDSLESSAGQFEAGMFSTTTKLSGNTVFVLGAVEGANQDPYTSKEALNFTYDTRISLDTSFTGNDLLKTRIRAGNIGSSTPFGSEAALETAYDSSSALNIDRNYYQFPIGDDFTATVGAVVRQDDMLGVWPSSYPSDSVLDVLTYAGANAAYSLAQGAGAGVTYAKDSISASLLWVGDEASGANPRSAGIGTNGGSDDITGQLAWIGDGITLAAVYTSSDGGNITSSADAEDYDAWGLSAQWDIDNDSAFIPSSINGGFGWKTPDKEDDANDIEDENTWSLGFLWNDVGAEGYNLGVGIGSAEGWRDDSGYDDPLAYEVYYSMAVSDNITVTPALFHVERDGSGTGNDDMTGGLVKTTFSF